MVHPKLFKPFWQVLFARVHFQNGEAREIHLVHTQKAMNLINLDCRITEDAVLLCRLSRSGVCRGVLRVLQHSPVELNSQHRKQIATYYVLHFSSKQQSDGGWGWFNGPCCACTSTQQQSSSIYEHPPDSNR